MQIRVGRPDDAKVLTAYNVAMAKVRTRLVAAILHLLVAARWVTTVAVRAHDSVLAAKWLFDRAGNRGSGAGRGSDPRRRRCGAP